MRLIKVNAPEGTGKDVVNTAFDVGIPSATVHKGERHSPNGPVERRDLIDIETSTPKAKAFVDALMASDYFDRSQFCFVVRQGRSLVSDEGFGEVTKPLVEPITDIFEELFQFSHLTFGLVGRAFVSGCLLAYGLIQYQILLIVAGLLFLPLLPLLLSLGFGTWTRRWKLVAQAAISFAVAIGLLMGAGLVVGALSEPPVKYDEFSSLTVSFLISLAVGTAAGLSTIDDVARRELIGLAATSQIALIPVWMGICLVLGFPGTTDSGEIGKHVLSVLVNIVTIIISSL
ncbi:MAG TPA: DUF389 domain-containing protein, partial [Pyrinomonadaceae bacterium]|nr:DUF389 domain-containing protein [Pyrinomonadaceae bacterium]